MRVDYRPSTHSPNHHFFQAAQVPVQVGLQRRTAKVQDRVEHQLTRAMVSHLR